MAILDWVINIENRIEERPPMKKFWSLENHNVPERPPVESVPALSYILPVPTPPVSLQGGGA